MELMTGFEPVTSSLPRIVYGLKPVLPQVLHMPI